MALSNGGITPGRQVVVSPGERTPTHSRSAKPAMKSAKLEIFITIRPLDRISDSGPSHQSHEPVRHSIPGRQLIPVFSKKGIGRFERRIASMRWKPNPS